MGPGFPSIYIFYRFTRQFPVFHVVLLIAPEPPTGPSNTVGFSIYVSFAVSDEAKNSCLATVILLYQVTFEPH
jgi:hypothetical protein